MSLHTEIADQLKDAMRAKDAVAMNTLRALKSALKYAAIEKLGAEGELEPTEAIAVVRKQIKQRRSRTLTSIVREEIAGMIASGDLAAGDRVNESELATRLGISRGPVREACRSLEEAGLLVSAVAPICQLVAAASAGARARSRAPRVRRVPPARWRERGRAARPGRAENDAARAP